MCNVTFRRVLETIVAVESDKHDFCSCVRARVGEGMRMRACVRPRVCVCVDEWVHERERVLALV